MMTVHHNATWAFVGLVVLPIPKRPTLKYGGGTRSRTEIHGFAIRCIAILPSRQIEKTSEVRGFYLTQKYEFWMENLERETRFELATPTLARLCSTN